MEELQGAEETERRAKERAVKAAAAEAAAEKRKATQARVERMKEWDEEEIRMLEKALEKFPQVSRTMRQRQCIFGQLCIMTKAQAPAVRLALIGTESRANAANRKHCFACKVCYLFC